jgi:hypothetical protein
MTLNNTRATIDITPEANTEYPLTDAWYAGHVRMSTITDENWRELLRRVRQIEEVMGRMLKGSNGEAISLATEEVARRHIGQRMGWGDYSAAEFDAHMGNVLARRSHDGTWPVKEG